jgi:hypothetical protein
VGTVGALKGKPGDRIKIYLVVGLALVLAALVYRHLKAKPSGNAPLSSPSVARGLAELVDLSPLNMGSLPKTQAARAKVKEPRRDFLRDVFAPRRSLKKAEQSITPKGDPGVQKAPGLKLKGVIVGGGNSVAIINGKLLRLGERIDGYQVVRIEEKKVFLRSGNSTFKLEMAKND